MAPIDPEIKLRDGSLSVAKLFLLAHNWIDYFVKKLNVSFGITRIILARFPFQNALLPSYILILLTQSRIPL
jgi:hypothetical protein